MWQNMVVRAILIVIPLLFVVLLPILFMVLANILPTASVQGMEKVKALLPQSPSYMNVRQTFFYVYSEFLGPMLYLIVVLMASCVTAASSFVGEKERGTMETLFLTPLAAREIFKAKVIGCVALAALTSLVSFLLYGIVLSIGDILLGVTAFWTNPTWAVMVFLLSPALILFGVLFMVLVSGRSRSFMESVQICGYVLLPLILLYICQYSGLVRMNAWLYFVVSILVLVADAVLAKVTSAHFTLEKLLG